MSCLGECWDFGPPPDSILRIPPPPAPTFLQLQQRVRDNATPIVAPCADANGAQLCASGSDWEPPQGDYVELSRQDVGTVDDTWPLVLASASVGVLVLGALLALFLLRCREQHGIKEHPQHRVNSKVAVTSSAPTAPSTNGEPDRAVCWAALTPRGDTQHFVSVDDNDEENHHYESIDGPWYRSNNNGTNSYYFDEPSTFLTTPNSVSQLPVWLQQQQDMRCLSTLRRPRPRVSPPTRIEHPNLPPLNLNPLPAVPPPPLPRRTPNGGTLSRRASDASTLLRAI